MKKRLRMMRRITWSSSFSLALVIITLLNFVICSKDVKLKKKRVSGATNIVSHSVSIPSSGAKSSVSITSYDQPSLDSTEIPNHEQEFSPTEADIKWRVVKADKDKEIQQVPLRGILKKPESPKSGKKVQFKEENELFTVPRLIYTSESISELSRSTSATTIGKNNRTNNKKITTTKSIPIMVAPEMVPLKPPAVELISEKEHIYAFATIREEDYEEEEEEEGEGEEVEEEEESDSDSEGGTLLKGLTDDTPSLNLLSWPNPFIPVSFAKHMMIMDILSTVPKPSYENLWEATVNYFSKHRPRIHRDKIRLHTRSNSSFLSQLMSYLAGKPDSRPAIEVWWEADPGEVNLSTPFPHDDEALEQFFSKTTVYQFVWKKAYTWKPLQFILGGPKQDKIAYLLFTDMTSEQIQQFHLPNTGKFIPNDKWQEKAWMYDVDCHYSNWPPRH